MGEDSIRPFLDHKGKWTIILGLTSNPGSADFELKKITDSIEISRKAYMLPKPKLLISMKWF
jgi:hypothetical protein